MAGEQVKEEVVAAANGRRVTSPKKIIVPVILVIALAAGGLWYQGRNKISTDDAQIGGDLVPISARISGYVGSISVDDNQPVPKGALLVQIDPRDLRAKLQRSEADLSMQQAQAAAAAGQVSVTERTAPASEMQAGAAVLSATAGIAATESQIASATAQAESAAAGVDAARGAIASGTHNVEAATAQIRAAESAVSASKAAVTAAQAQATRIASDLARAHKLLENGAVSRQQVDSAEAASTSAQAALDAARDQSESAVASRDQAKARMAGAQADLRQAKARLASSLAAVQQAKAGVKLAQVARSQAEAGLRQAQAGRSAASCAPNQIAITQSQRKAADARIRQSAADLNNARLQFSYTRITAPVAGIVSKKSVELGQFVQPGQALMALVPTDQLWVDANFKETQIGRLRVGNKAEIEIDTFPGKKLSGRVDSIGAATGSKFSLLPPENATGNFVKIVQRVPVKIALDKLPKGIALRPGMNVTATVDLGE